MKIIDISELRNRGMTRDEPPSLPFMDEATKRRKLRGVFESLVENTAFDIYFAWRRAVFGAGKK